MKIVFQRIQEEIEHCDAWYDHYRRQRNKSEALRFMHDRIKLKEAHSIFLYGMREFCERKLRELRGVSYAQDMYNLTPIRDQGKKELLEQMLEELNGVLRGYGPDRSTRIPSQSLYVR